MEQTPSGERLVMEEIHQQEEAVRGLGLSLWQNSQWMNCECKAKKKLDRRELCGEGQPGLNSWCVHLRLCAYKISCPNHPTKMSVYS